MDEPSQEEEATPAGVERQETAEEADPTETQDSTVTLEDKERGKPRVPSALTVENVKKHEEETDAIDVVELMTKNAPEENGVEKEEKQETETLTEAEPVPFIDSGAIVDTDEPLEYPEEDRAATPIGDKIAQKQNEAESLLSDVWSQPKKPSLDPIVSPAVREVIRGQKFTGEEYLAISIDVQTDESWIADTFDWPQDNLGQDFVPLPGHPPQATAAADGQVASSTDTRYRKHITSDLSSSGIVDEESVLHIAHSQSATSGLSIQKERSFLESDTEDENPVTELTESEFGGSEALTHTTTKTLPSVGPPTILQYKAESKTIPIDYNNIETNAMEGVGWDDMTPDQTEYYTKMVEDMKRVRSEKLAEQPPENNLISIEPHAAYGSRQERKLAKERERERSRMREMEKQIKQMAGGAPGGQMAANQTNFYAFARQLKTVNYALSSEKCMEEGWTIRPVTPPTPEEVLDELFVHDPNDDIISGKKYEHMFVRKSYPNGQLFLTVFPDGTGNVWYPTGNVAVSIIASEKPGKLSFILHEDVHQSEGQNIQAVFEPTGHCTCYYPSGIVRLLLTPSGGEYYSPQGERVKKWIWKDTQTHVHAPPFQPITFALSRKVGVRIASQESVYITFSDGRRSVRFNAGTRLRYRQSNTLPKIEQIDADQVLLEATRAHMRTVLQRINDSLKFPNSPRLKHLRLPTYLAAQVDRAAKMKARLLEQQLEQGDAKKKVKKPSGCRKQSSAETLPKVLQATRRMRLRRNLYQRPSDETDEKLQPVVIVN